MNLSTVKGYLGELLVKEMLESEGVDVAHHGNQSGVDLSFQGKHGTVRIDVKMSMPKDEFGCGFEYWGWALKHESKKRDVTATHFVCIGCSERVEVESVFVIPAKNVANFPCGYGQFTKVKHGFVVPRKRVSFGGIRPEQFFMSCANLLSDGVAIRLRKRQKLSAVCA